MKLEIIRGEPTPEEIAALTTVLVMRGGADEGGAVQKKAESWRNPARSMRKQLTPGKSAWRNSALP